MSGNNEYRECQFGDRSIKTNISGDQFNAGRDTVINNNNNNNNNNKNQEEEDYDMALLLHHSLNNTSSATSKTAATNGESPAAGIEGEVQAEAPALAAETAAPPAPHAVLEDYEEEDYDINTNTMKSTQHIGKDDAGVAGDENNNNNNNNVANDPVDAVTAANQPGAPVSQIVAAGGAGGAGGGNGNNNNNNNNGIMVVGNNNNNNNNGIIQGDYPDYVPFPFELLQDKEFYGILSCLSNEDALSRACLVNKAFLHGCFFVKFLIHVKLEYFVKEENNDNGNNDNGNDNGNDNSDNGDSEFMVDFSYGMRALENFALPLNTFGGTGIRANGNFGNHGASVEWCGPPSTDIYNPYPIADNTNNNNNFDLSEIDFSKSSEIKPQVNEKKKAKKEWLSLHDCGSHLEFRIKVFKKPKGVSNDDCEFGALGSMTILSDKSRQSRDRLRDAYRNSKRDPIDKQ